MPSSSRVYVRAYRYACVPCLPSSLLQKRRVSVALLSPTTYLYLSFCPLLSLSARLPSDLTLSLNSPRIPRVHPSGRQPCLALAAPSVARVRARVFVAPIRLEPHWPPTFSFLAEVNAFSRLFGFVRSSTTIDLETEILSYDSVRFDVTASQRSYFPRHRNTLDRSISMKRRDESYTDRKRINEQTRF